MHICRAAYMIEIYIILKTDVEENSLLGWLNFNEIMILGIFLYEWVPILIYNNKIVSFFNNKLLRKTVDYIDFARYKITMRKKKWI